MKPIYYLDGNVRGSCPHMHRSLRAAARCAAEDQKGCAKRGGYSDRTLRKVGGWARESEWEADDIEFSDFLAGFLR